MLERVSLRPRVYTPRALFYARVYLITIPATAPPPLDRAGRAAPVPGLRRVFLTATKTR